MLFFPTEPLIRVWFLSADPNAVASPDGDCDCQLNTVDVGGRCVPLSKLLPAILLPIFATFLVSGYIYHVVFSSCSELICMNVLRLTTWQRIS